MKRGGEDQSCREKLVLPQGLNKRILKSMALQNESSNEESVTNRTTKRLKDCNNVVHLTYMIIVPQQSDSIVVFLQTSPSKFSDNVTIHNIDIIQHNFES